MNVVDKIADRVKYSNVFDMNNLIIYMGAGVGK